MQVRVGNSVEMADGSWRKQDITLDEDDLFRLLEEANCDVGQTNISSQEAFQILEAEAQRLLLAMMITRYSTMMRSSENIAQVEAYKTQRDSLLNALRKKAEPVDEH